MELQVKDKRILMFGFQPPLQPSRSAWLSRMNIDFSFDFHIRKIRENRISVAWILDFSHLVHQNLSAHLWTRRNLLIPADLFVQKTV